MRGGSEREVSAVSDLRFCFFQFAASRLNGCADSSMRVFGFVSPDGVNQSLEEGIAFFINIIQLTVVLGVLGTCVQITIGCFDLLSCRTSRLHDHGDRIKPSPSLRAFRILHRPVFRRSMFPWHLLIPVD
jgi:hypothetical protein